MTGHTRSGSSLFLRLLPQAPFSSRSVLHAPLSAVQTSLSVILLFFFLFVLHASEDYTRISWHHRAKPTFGKTRHKHKNAPRKAHTQTPQPTVCLCPAKSPALSCPFLPCQNLLSAPVPAKVWAFSFMSAIKTVFSLL